MLDLERAFDPPVLRLAGVSSARGASVAQVGCSGHSGADAASNPREPTCRHVYAGAARLESRWHVNQETGRLECRWVRPG